MSHSFVHIRGACLSWLPTLQRGTMEPDEKRIIKENYLEQVHKKALAVCDYLTEEKNLRDALALAGLKAREFYQARREHQDVCKAYQDAQEVLAELKMARLDDMSAQLINEEGMTVGTYTAVTKTEKWAVEKLNPNRYGSKASPVAQTLVQNNVQILQSLSDEQIMEIVSGGAAPQALLTPNDKKELDSVLNAEYKEVCSDRLPCEGSAKHNTTVATPEPPSTQTPTQTPAPIPEYDLSAFGDLA